MNSSEPAITVSNGCPGPPPPLAPPPSDPLPPPPGPETLTSSNPYASLPPGWSTAVDSRSGRVYFWEISSGKTLWSHPWAVQNDTSSSSGGVGSLFGRRSAPVVPTATVGTGTSSNDKRFQESLLPHQENPVYASKRPDSSECNSVLSFLLCPPLGLLALYHSFSVNSAWNDGRYGDAVHHARQAPKYGTLAIVVGVIFWIYFLFFRDPSVIDWEWPDFNFGD